MHALIARSLTSTNAALLEAGLGRWGFMTPEAALGTLSPGDVVVGRIDVRETLDGPDEGLWVLGALQARGLTVLNDAAALLATHDKLSTARLLHRRGVPHPATLHVRADRPFSGLRAPAVVKPRFGSGGRGVVLCSDHDALFSTLAELEDCPWSAEQGVLVQELIPPRGYDLRIVVAGGRQVGAAYRIAAEGEWRTNVSLGGVRRPVPEPPADAVGVAMAAAHAVGAVLVGVDLVLDERDGWTVIEVNGAVEFATEYLVGGDVFAEAIAALEAYVLAGSYRTLPQAVQ